MSESLGFTGLRDIAPSRILSGVARPKAPAAIAVGQRIRKARLDAGYAKQKDFAKAIGSSQSELSGWETGARRPELPTLRRIAKAPKVTATIDELAGDSYDSLDTTADADDKSGALADEIVTTPQKGQGKTERSTPPDHGTVRPKEFEQPAMLKGCVYDGQDSTRLLRAAAEKEARSLETQADFFEDLAERFRDFARDIRAAKRKPRVPPRRRRSRRKASR